MIFKSIDGNNVRDKSVLNLCLQIIFFLTSYATPLALICGLYLWLLVRLWRGAAPGGHVSAESRRGKKRVTRMVVVVVVIFAVCWFPIQVRQNTTYIFMYRFLMFSHLTVPKVLILT